MSEEITNKISALFNNGFHNKIGVFATLAVLVFSWLPIYSGFGLYVPLINLIAKSGYKSLFVILLLVLAILFYGGATRLYTRILGVILLVMMSLFVSIPAVITKLPVAWGMYVNLVAWAALLLAIFFTKYTNNEESI